MARQGNRPVRRVARVDLLGGKGRRALAERVSYAGSPHHKRSSGDYGYHPPASPRPSKSLRDGHRVILRAEAQSLLEKGIMLGMFSTFEGDRFPKYVWSVDKDQEVYEAKTGRDVYHGYRLEDEDDMRSTILKEWNARCLAD